MRLIIRTCNYQTYVLLLLWVSGLIKPFIIAYIINFDIVLFALAIATIDGLFQLGKGIKLPSTEYLAVIGIIVLLYIYICSSLLYTSSSFYAYEKVVGLIPNLVFILYAGTLRKVNLTKFIKVYSILLIPLSLFFIYMKSIVWIVDSEATQIFKELRNYYLGVGLHLGILFILCYYKFRQVWLLALIAFLLVASSARAALLFLVLTFLTFEFVRLPKIRFKKKLLYIGLISFLFSSILVFSLRSKILPLLQTSIVRFRVLFKGGGKSTTERLDAMSFAITEAFSDFTTFAFGNGIGSFGLLYMGNDGRAYPHNIFLEILFEVGLIGLILLLSIFLVVFYSGIKGNKLLFVLFFYCFINAMKSSSFTDLWVLFSIMGLILNQRRINFINRNR